MKIMAVDYGDVRTGLAISDSTETLASPAGVIEETNYKTLTKKLADKSKELDAQLIIIGEPLNMDGSKGIRAEKCEKLARFLTKFVSIPVKLWDERQSTVEADLYLHRADHKSKNRKNVIDAAAATVILQSYLAFRQNRLMQD